MATATNNKVNNGTVSQVVGVVIYVEITDGDLPAI